MWNLTSLHILLKLDRQLNTASTEMSGPKIIFSSNLLFIYHSVWYELQCSNSFFQDFPGQNYVCLDITFPIFHFIRQDFFPPHSIFKKLFDNSQCYSKANANL